MQMGERKTIFFHTIDQEEIVWQGIVLTELPLGHLEIQLFSWLTGEPTEIMIVEGKDHQWIFYTNEDAWRKASEQRP